MNKLFVPYELAILAKEKGFDEPCFGWYSILGRLTTVNISKERTKYNEDTEAPLYQQLIDDFRVRHGIEINRVPSASPNLWIIYKKSDPIPTKSFTDIDYYTALNKALEEAFKLI